MKISKLNAVRRYKKQIYTSYCKLYQKSGYNKNINNKKTFLYPISGYNQANPLKILLKRGIPVLFIWLKHTFVGIVCNKSFSICFDVINESLLDIFTISLYDNSDWLFFSNAPDILIHKCGRNECGIPAPTMEFNFSVRGKRISTLSQVNCDTSLLCENSKWAIHCNRCCGSSTNGIPSSLFELCSGPSSSSTRKPNSSNLYSNNFILNMQ